MRPDNSFDRRRFARLWQRMGELGVRFAVATGNQHFQVRQLFGPVYAPRLGIVSQDGTYVADGEDEVHVSVMGRDLVSRTVEVLRGLGAGVQACGAAGAYVERGSGPAFFEDLLAYYVRLGWVDDVCDVDDRITMLVAQMPTEEAAIEAAALIEGRLPGQVSASPSGDGYIDVVKAGRSKATGLAHLAARWGIDAGEVVAFGNAHNDLAMIQWVGLGYMMENAPDDLKALADRVAPPCSEDGVLTVLEGLLGL